MTIVAAPITPAGRQPDGRCGDRAWRGVPAAVVTKDKVDEYEQYAFD